jgi:hypothetical protein
VRIEAFAVNPLDVMMRARPTRGRDEAQIATVQGLIGAAI